MPKKVKMQLQGSHDKALSMKELAQLEDLYWKMKADEAKKDLDLMSPEETMAFLTSK